MFKKANMERMEVSDKRGRKINEIITGAKIIKFNAWEKIMNELIKSYRDLEGSKIFKAFTLFNMSHAISSLIPILLGLTIFTLYDGELEVSQIYELVTLFNATLVPIRYYIMAVMGLADSRAASKRINQLMQIEPIEPLKDDQSLNLGVMEIEGGNFNWEDPKYFQIFEGKKMNSKTKNNFILKNISLRINKGEFVAVIGKVGSGKSSLILALMDEMVRHNGEVRKNGKIAYISQETFLQNDTIQNNITFGKKFEEEKFQETIKICQMLPDLAILPGREKTEIGERGINMSGGQKQRINISRAVYSDSEIYLIDDALSALDAYVGKKIMREVFMGKLRGKTRVMVTHYLNLLSEVDKVVLIDEGEIKAYGTFESVKQTDAFKQFANAKDEESKKTSLVGEIEAKGSKLEKEEKEQSEEDQEEEEIPVRDTDVEQLEEQELEVAPMEEELKKEEPKIEEVKPKPKKNDEDAGKLMTEEKRDVGSVGVKYYGYYIKNSGICLFLITIFLFGASITMKMAGDWWVGQWQEDAYDLPKNTYLEVYAAFGIASFIFLAFRAFALGAVSKLAAVNIFKSIIWNILRRPMSFFDTTPCGVIINRCTSDVDQLDYLIPWMLAFFLNMVFNFLGALILASVVSPTVIIFILLALLLVSKSLSKFMKTTTEMKRLVQLTASPVLSLCSEFIEGASIIRIYGKKGDMVDRYNHKADVHHEAFYHDEIIMTWLRMRLEGGLALVVIFTIFSIVISRQVQ